jgi:hypothetical protein
MTPGVPASGGRGVVGVQGCAGTGGAEPHDHHVGLDVPGLTVPRPRARRARTLRPLALRQNPAPFTLALSAKTETRSSMEAREVA